MEIKGTALRWVVSDECEPVSARLLSNLLCRAKFTPLGESGGAVELEIGPAVEMAFLVEVVMDRGVDGDEFLQTSHAPKSMHGPFSSSEWQV